MKHNATPPDVERVMSGLKDFQRRSAEYIFHRLYTAKDTTDRFLLADEVGLGKTVVARGVVAKAINHLWNDVERIDVIYICSNLDIARQNIHSLNVTGQSDIALTSRLTLLPVHLQKLSENKVNFVSFTPGTSFNVRASRGLAEERVLLYYLAREAWGFYDNITPKYIFQSDVYSSNWDSHLRSKRDLLQEIDPVIRDVFIDELRDNNDFRGKFEALLEMFLRFRRMANTPSERRRLPHEMKVAQTRFIGSMRRRLARTSLNALEPDLVILDEFQRFKNLLDEEDEMALLARELFEYPDVKTLLLSATPYKMYTMHHESEDNDHYRDFISTVKFLHNNPEKLAQLESSLTDYRSVLRKGQHNPAALSSCREAIEDNLLSVMIRTERINLTAEKDGMLAEQADIACCPSPSDLTAFRLVDEVATAVRAHDTVEYWKSAPYLLNFMDKQGYKLKQAFMDRLDDPILTSAVQHNQSALLSWADFHQYKEVDPQNARMRLLMQNTVQQGAWKLLWIPASKPYYASPGTPFDDLPAYSKSLIFSSWQVVPKAIASLVSYEAERLALGAGETYDQTPVPLLRFANVDGRLASFTVFTLLYPSITLATYVDPLEISAGLPTEERTMDRVMEVAKSQIERILDEALPDTSDQTGAEDDRWYALAPLLLDHRNYGPLVADWLHSTDKELQWNSADGDGSDTVFAQHVDFMRETLKSGGELRRRPKDLAEILAKSALGSPAVVALRSFLRQTEGHEKALEMPALAAAARVAHGFRTLLNLRESIAVVRATAQKDEQRYWESALDYCIMGNVQAVLDEYVHVLSDGPQHSISAASLLSMACEIKDSISLRAATLEFDEFSVDDDPPTIKSRPRRLRCRFALRFGDASNQEDETRERKDTVRRAFNSPFRPFVLASTSIGQEGLDFHRYCHNIYHWNLPSNPVDLEQREGRIHRYKGHAIRKNVAKAYPGLPVPRKIKDPWQELFAHAQRSKKQSDNDLIPFWLYETKCGEKINRYIPSMPLSREIFQIESLRQNLAVYRLVFGQPRQEDLLAFLNSHDGLEGADPRLLEHRIRLEPPDVIDACGYLTGGEPTICSVTKS